MASIVSFLHWPWPAGPTVARTHAAGPQLSSDAVRRFREDGVLALPGVCAGSELGHLRRVLMDQFEAGTGRAEGHQFDMLGADREAPDPIQSQLLHPSRYAPDLRHTPHFRRMQAIARQLLGPEATFSFDHAILKRSGTVAATPWHQDEAHHRDRGSPVEQVSFWMPLQDVTEHDGCMRYLRGSHRGPLLPHRPLHGNPRIHALECLATAFDASAAVALPVPAGSCILHAGRTLHAGVPSRAGVDRLVYVIVFEVRRVRGLRRLAQAVASRRWRRSMAPR